MYYSKENYIKIITDIPNIDIKKESCADNCRYFEFLIDNIKYDVDNTMEKFINENMEKCKEKLAQDLNDNRIDIYSDVLNRYEKYVLDDEIEIYRNLYNTYNYNKLSYEDILDIYEEIKDTEFYILYNKLYYRATNAFFTKIIKYKEYFLSEAPIIEMTYKQIIYSGAPGTGKSYEIENVILNGLGSDFYNRVTFYEDYEYHNFIGTIMPCQKEDKIIYEFNPGPFTDLLLKSLKYPDEMHYLVIEEMTRGNAAAIFGDIFQLLDRDYQGNSNYPIVNKNISNYIKDNMTEYTHDYVYLPKNFSILATINSSDQNVYVLDTAFKRRFKMKHIDVEQNKEYIDDFEIFNDIWWRDFYMNINDFIISKLGLNEDRQVGPFFITDAEDKDKLVMYLWDDVIGQYGDKNLLFKNNIYRLTDALSKQNIKDLFSDDFLEYLVENQKIIEDIENV